MSITTAVTGLGWMGTGVRSIQTALKEMLRDAQDEVLICAYSMTGGAGDVLEEFEACLKRGVRVVAVVNRFVSQPQGVQRYFQQLTTTYEYCQVYSFNDFDEELHSKLIVIDRKVALVGSANLSMRGMQQNYELGVLIRNSEVQVIAGCFDNLIQLPAVSPISQNDLNSGG